MAKPIKNRNGAWHITAAFRNQRRKLTLGLISKPEADVFAANLKILIDHRRRKSTIQPALASWVQSLSDKHRQQLGEINVLSKHDVDSTVQRLIKDFLEHYDRRKDISDSTKTSMRQSLKHRIPPLLKRRKLSELVPTQSDDMPNSHPVFSTQAERIMVNVVSWQREHYALSSWSRANGRLNEVGNWAVQRGICKFNPFSRLPQPEQVNIARNEHVESGWALDVMANCLDPDTRLVIAMGRFSGMRTPSECRRMKPNHVDFENSQLTIVGKGRNRPIRTMPLFDTVRAELLKHREAVGWDRYVFSERFLSKSDSNNYGLVREAALRAGFDCWPRLRQNLRSSCENDLLEAGFPERLVVAWLGHTIRTSRKSYQQQTASDREKSIERARQFGI